MKHYIVSVQVTSMLNQDARPIDIDITVRSWLKRYNTDLFIQGMSQMRTIVVEASNRAEASSFAIRKITDQTIYSNATSVKEEPVLMLDGIEILDIQEESDVNKLLDAAVKPRSFPNPVFCPSNETFDEWVDRMRSKRNV